MTTKRPAKKAPVTKSTKTEEAKSHKEAFNILKTIVEKVDIGDYCEEGKEILRNAAKIVGSKKFSSGTVDFSFDGVYIHWEDLSENDTFDCVVTLINKRTKETKIETIYGYTDINMGE